MADDRKQELERLEKELLADIADDDDLLADLPIELLDTMPLSWTDETDLPEDMFLSETPTEETFSAEIPSEEDFSPEEYPEETEFPVQTDVQDGEFMKNSKKKSPKSSRAARKLEDRWLITLMIVASFLCLGIIAVLIYWMEAFFK